jgi:hypothetical protein
MCDKKNLPWFVIWYDFYPTLCVFSIPSPRLGDRKYKTRWIKVISNHKPWEILYLFFIYYIMPCINLSTVKVRKGIFKKLIYSIISFKILTCVHCMWFAMFQKSGHIGNDEQEIAAGKRSFMKLFRLLL